MLKVTVGEQVFMVDACKWSIWKGTSSLICYNEQGEKVAQFLEYTCVEDVGEDDEGDEDDYYD